MIKSIIEQLSSADINVNDDDILFAQGEDMYPKSIADVKRHIKIYKVRKNG